MGSPVSTLWKGISQNSYLALNLSELNSIRLIVKIIFI